MNFIEILNCDTKKLCHIFESKYNIEDVDIESIEEMLEKARNNKKKINKLFQIDEKIGYKKITTKIDKTKMIENFLKDKEVYFLNLCQKFLENKFKNNRVIIEDYKIDKSKITLYYYQAKQNKALFCFKELETDIESILPNNDLKNLMTTEFFIDTNDVIEDYYYKILKECKEEIDLYVVTSNYAIIFGSDSKSFQSCQNFEKDYHSGNWYNFLSSNVFMIVRLDKEDRLMSRCWAYIDENNNIIIGRLYNATRMTGRHILNMLESLGLIKIEDYAMKKIKIISECDIGYPDFENRLFISVNCIDQIKVESVEIHCLECNNKSVFYDPVKVPSCCQKDDDLVGHCNFCGGSVYESDDYIWTDDDNLYHSDCEGFFCCDICNRYRDGNDYNLIYNSRNSELICCDNCLENDTFYCENCQDYYIIEDYDIEETKNGCYCINCVKKYGLGRCGDCRDMIFDFDNYIETKDGTLFHAKCDGYSACDCCDYYHLEDDLKYVQVSQEERALYCEDCIKENAVLCGKCKQYFLKKDIETTESGDYCVYCMNEIKEVINM